MPRNGRQQNKAKTKSKQPDYSAICQLADGAQVLHGFEKLGPIRNFTDLLLPSNNADASVSLAAEQMCHMIEGWRYGASAATAYLNNSQQNAVHFAYYAELRAALSLLSWSGIRIRQGDHYYINANGLKTPIENCRTHTAVWALWQHWTTRPDADQLFKEKVKLIPGVSLSDTLNSLQYVRPNATLQNWGIDLAQIKEDHNARNTASYEAFWANNSLKKMTKSDASLILELWKLILPSEGSSLRFDGALVSYFVKSAVIGMSQNQDQNQTILAISRELAKNTGTEQETILRRLDPSNYNTTPFDLASSKNCNPENIICRAFFLLRLSMLALKTSLSSTKNNAARSWLSNWLEHAGLWQNSELIDPADIPEDYELAVESMNINGSLPFDVWQPQNVEHTAKLLRPDACLIWNML